MMPANFETLMGMDAMLVERGHLPLSPWWQEQLARFYEHETARQLVARVGRGGIKSQSSAKVALNEVLFGDWDVPLGEVHCFAFVSATKDEASQRLMLLRRFLTDLGVEHDAAGDEITLRDKPLGFRVFAGQVGAVSGFRCIGFVCDEVAKWKSADRFTNPASEVVASLKGMVVTHKAARRLLVSSPLAMVDYHYQQFEQGNTAQQLVCEAATWGANPSVTEAQTRELEPDERIWKREYAAIPQAAALAAFEPANISSAFAWPASTAPSGTLVGVIDASSGKKDSWTWGVCGWRTVEGTRRLVFDRIGGFEGRFWDQMTGEQVIATVADTFKAMGVHKVFGDQREALMVGAGFRRLGLKFHELPWTAPTKERAVGLVRRWLADGLLCLPEHEKLRFELLSFEERATASGGFTFGARGAGHDDYVALLLTAAMADHEKLLPASPAKGGMYAALMGGGSNGGNYRRFFESPEENERRFFLEVLPQRKTS